MDVVVTTVVVTGLDVDVVTGLVEVVVVTGRELEVVFGLPIARYEA